MRNPVDDLDGLTKSEFNEYLDSCCKCDKYNTMRDLVSAVKLTESGGADELRLINDRLTQLQEAIGAYRAHINSEETES